MTTADQPQEKSAWLAHNFTLIACAFLASVATNQIWHDNWIALVFGLIMPVVAVAATLADVRHVGTLCEPCMASVPTNGPEVAEKNLRLLWFFHHWQVRVLTGFCVLALATFFSPWINYPVWAALIASHHIQARHRRLELWCPWCRHRRGDDEVTVPPPVPTTEGTR